MAIAASQMKPEGQARHSHPPRVAWVDVLRTPYMGDHPDLPEIDGGWPEMTLRWWDIAHRMPHCRLWDEADWNFAVETAIMHGSVFADYMAAPITKLMELRRREFQMGWTYDARQTLRIRYIDGDGDKVETPVESDEAAMVTNLDDFRRLYGE